MNTQNENEENKLKQTTDFLPSGAAACSASSDTPETNRFYESFADGEAIPNQAEWLALCERLETERDEARQEAIRWQDAWANDTDLHKMGGTVMPWMRGWIKSQPNAERRHAEGETNL